MNSKINIEINKDSFHISKYKSITGEIYFKIDNRFFPEEGWSDFPVVILTWWIKSLLQITQGKIDTSQEFLFMDGPLLIKGRKIDVDTLEMDFVHREVTQFTANCSIIDLKLSIINISRIVMDCMIKNEWETKDTKELGCLIKFITSKYMSL